MWRYYPDLLAKPVPRYTSYPTAVEFSNEVGAEEYGEAIDRVEAATPVSLYVHIPFCEQICWYCGCNTGASSRKQRLTDYLAALHTEIVQVARRMGGRGRIRRIAFGGGSPNAISPIEFVRLVDRIQTVFDACQPDISIEIDPRGFTAEWAMVLAASNVSRVSLGVQTFAPHIQQAIGRVQPLEDIERTIAALRLRGIKAINFDLMYGLPNQSLGDLDATLDEAIRLAPSRIALFGYAHIPQMLPRQKRIDASNLPDMQLRFDQAALGYEKLTQAGYIAVGFDHFALPDDPLAEAAAQGTVNRNFQGFTEDTAPILLGFGASAISKFPDLIVQNEKRAGPYRDIAKQSLITANRGVWVDAEDQERGRIIRDLLCKGDTELDPAWLPSAQQALMPFADHGLIDWQQTRLHTTPDAIPYVRLIAAQFDRYRNTAIRPDAGHNLRIVSQ